MPIRNHVEIVPLSECCIACGPVYLFILAVFAHGFSWNNDYDKRFLIIYRTKSRKMITGKELHFQRNKSKNGCALRKSIIFGFKKGKKVMSTGLTPTCFDARKA
jgi:hypothetical protein